MALNVKKKFGSAHHYHIHTWIRLKAYIITPLIRPHFLCSWIHVAGEQMLFHWTLNYWTLRNAYSKTERWLISTKGIITVQKQFSVFHLKCCMCAPNRVPSRFPWICITCYAFSSTNEVKTSALSTLLTKHKYCLLS